MAERRFKVLLGAALIVVVVLLVYELFHSNPPAPRPPPPNPDGYDDFVQAAQFAAGNGGDLSLSQGELRELIVKNAEALRLVRQGLNRSCRVRADFTSAKFSPHMNELDGMKKLVW